MNCFELISFSIILPYIAVIFSFTVGFLRLKTFSPFLSKPSFKNIKLSVLIPFKNEEMNLPVIYNNLRKQTLDKDFFEVIFINDHSEDASECILKDLIKSETNFKLINLRQDNKGKKQALNTGIKKAENKIIVISDADCYHPDNWLYTFYHYFSEYQAKLIIAPVIMNGVGFFGKLQALEFLSLTASTAGASGIGHSIMCNGANLAFRKDTFYEFEDAMNLNEISGDDVFLLHSVKKKYSKDIHYLKSKDATVFTDSEPTLKSFFRQRIRWTSKSKSYFDFDTILSSVIVLFVNVLILALFTASFFSTNAFYVFISVFTLKILFDFTLLYLTVHFFKQKNLLKYFPLIVIFYPFYIVFTAVFSVFVKGVKWKD